MFEIFVDLETPQICIKNTNKELCLVSQYISICDSSADSHIKTDRFVIIQHPLRRPLREYEAIMTSLKPSSHLNPVQRVFHRI